MTSFCFAYLGKRRKRRLGRLNWPFLQRLRRTAQLPSARDPQENRLVFDKPESHFQTTSYSADFIRFYTYISKFVYDVLRFTGCNVTSVSSGITCSASASSPTTSRRTRTLSASTARGTPVTEGVRSGSMTPAPVTWTPSEMFSTRLRKFLNHVYILNVKSGPMSEHLIVYSCVLI